MNAAVFFTSLRGRMLSQNARHRWSVASRALAAIVGGYALTSLANISVPLLLGAMDVNVPQALYAISMGSFLLYAAIVMAVFHARSAARAWLWLIGASLPLAVVACVLFPVRGA
jgi:hypothetical protein